MDRARRLLPGAALPLLPRHRLQADWPRPAGRPIDPGGHWIAVVPVAGPRRRAIFLVASGIGGRYRSGHLCPGDFLRWPPAEVGPRPVFSDPRVVADFVVARS